MVNIIYQTSQKRLQRQGRAQSLTKSDSASCVLTYTQLKIAKREKNSDVCMLLTAELNTYYAHFVVHNTYAAIRLHADQSSCTVLSGPDVTKSHARHQDMMASKGMS